MVSQENCLRANRDCSKFIDEGQLTEEVIFAFYHGKIGLTVTDKDGLAL